MEIRDQKIKHAISELAAKFIQEESSGASLVTVTDVRVTNDGKNALILFTALPEEKMKTVELFLKRKRGDFQEYVRLHSRIGRIPFFDFAIDLGEKNRQNIDRISNAK
ncbi:MAG: ribosome-binding factor A [Candidatus Taylorbacteria bacterium]